MSDDSNVMTLAQWLSCWKDFKKLHRGWVAKLPAGEAAYILPEPIIKELISTRGHRQLPPLLIESDAQAERDFGKVCRKFGPWVIGVCDEGPLQFPLLFEWWNEETKSIQTVGETIEDSDEASFKQSITSTHQQQLAYAGSLSFHRPFRQEVDLLRSKWLSLLYPRPATGPWMPAQLARQLQGAIADGGYYQLYDIFRSRWHLAMLVSWDVPWPITMEGISSQLAATLFGQGTERDYFPPLCRYPTEEHPRKRGSCPQSCEGLPRSSNTPPDARNRTAGLRTKRARIVVPFVAVGVDHPPTLWQPAWPPGGRYSWFCAASGA